MTKQDNQLNDDEAIRLAQENGNETELRELILLSKLWSKKSNKVYNHSAMLCWEALQACLSGRRVTIAQLDPGNGKSFLILLAALYITKVLKQK
jgi:hypothetical protein